MLAAITVNEQLMATSALLMRVIRFIGRIARAMKTTSWASAQNASRAYA